jgi:hypothetical protein
LLPCCFAALLPCWFAKFEINITKLQSSNLHPHFSNL